MEPEQLKAWVVYWPLLMALGIFLTWAWVVG